MKIAYLVSKYPAVSHTFILREVTALRARGVEVGTFSVRRPDSGDILGSQAAEEASRTRWLVPVPILAWPKALLWAFVTRPVLTCRRLLRAVFQREMSLRQRWQWLLYFAEAVLLAHWLRKGKFQHLHCHFGNSGASTGMLAAALAGMPFSITCHGSELLDPLRHRLAQKVAQASFVACVSQHAKAQLMLTCPPEHWAKLHVVRCAPPPCQPYSRRPPSDTDGILCVGRLSPEKGHVLLLEALAMLARNGRQVCCTLVGDGPMRPVIQERIARLGLGDSVLLAGALPVEEVLALDSRARVVVLASLTEGVPVVLMEAMACGCPVVATRVGGVSELVLDGVTGRLVPPGDPEALVEAIGWVLDNPAKALTLAERARAFVAREFREDLAIQTLIDLFSHGSRGRTSD
jgi:colanic acid/amylovoran biosynthesis glycosyltransferase